MSESATDNCCWCESDFLGANSSSAAERLVEGRFRIMMKRVASTTDIHVLNNRPDPLFCQSPPRCDFNDEDGYARREFNRLSNKEKDEVMKDIYGIEDPVEETPSLVRDGLDQMETILMGTIKKITSLQLARDRFPSFFEDEAFRLQFLRVDAFNAKRACNRLVRHYEKKIELFGPDLLGRKIRLDDLSEEDMKFMYSGGIEVLPAKDRGGRHVMFSSHRNWKYKNVKNVVRALFMQFMIFCVISISTLLLRTASVHVVFVDGSRG